MVSTAGNPLPKQSMGFLMENPAVGFGPSHANAMGLGAGYAMSSTASANSQGNFLDDLAAGLLPYEREIEALANSPALKSEERLGVERILYLIREQKKSVPFYGKMREQVLKQLVLRFYGPSDILRLQTLTREAVATDFEFGERRFPLFRNITHRSKGVDYSDKEQESERIFICNLLFHYYGQQLHKTGQGDLGETDVYVSFGAEKDFLNSCKSERKRAVFG